MTSAPERPRTPEGTATDTGSGRAEAASAPPPPGTPAICRAPDQLTAPGPTTPGKPRGPGDTDTDGTRAEAAAPPPPPGTPAIPLRTAVCRAPDEFAALGPAWNRLHRSCPPATAFQTHAWLHSWWLSYGVPGRLRLVLVWRGGDLVGAAPLMRVRRPYPVLVPLGGAITDYLDVLVDPGADAAGEVTAALADGVRRAARGAVVDLREVRAGAAAEALYACWRGPRRRLPDAVCLELPGVPMDELIARVGSSRGQRIRSALRKLDAAGVVERDVPAAQAPAAVAAILRLHLLQWRGRGVTPEHERPRFAAHLARAAQAMVASGDAVLTEFALGGEVVAVNLTVLSPGLAGGYLYGARPELRGTRVDLNTLLTRHGVRQAAGGGRATLSLLRGAEPYKSHWRPDHRANQRLLLAAGPAAPLLLVRYALARCRAAAGARPGLRALRDRLRPRGAAR
ncbi:GNAT family N-acetyltransferase [Actinacidiphila sp. ITFR-21]|uniref:GNAT family N-acetyltransferase n=1 Tax=Actinacidiphila sp. ITFR-21 TaxID=3075199 RepID=UPI00288ACB7A|nr:GNAT family N-acetyltransferase [Streptomyces sp. ITFR-21]WNI16489.1 GNAT family N-acetyltransferase [Streptomyces sp. ITFR-21]